MSDLLDISPQIQPVLDCAEKAINIPAKLYEIFSLCNRNEMSQDEFIATITPLISNSVFPQKDTIKIRHGLIQNLEQQRITNPLDKNEFHKANFTLILERLWLYGDREKPLFETYSGLKFEEKFGDIEAEFKKEFLGFFTDKLLHYIYHGTEAFHHNDVFSGYAHNAHYKKFVLVFKEAFRILQTNEYLDCIGDGIEQREEFKKIIQKIDTFFII